MRGIAPYIVGLVLMVMLFKKLGGDSCRGRVVGIIGKMGSGKSYFAVRMAYRRMVKGAAIYSNFSMHLDPLHPEPCPEKCETKGRCKCVRHCPCQMAKRWTKFTDWEQFLGISHAVVIIDEADLLAPAHDNKCISDAVRWKLKMCRKHKIDLYWIAQDHSQVSRLLRSVLTNEIRVCESWFGGYYFSAKTYPPKLVGRKGKHTSRSGFALNKRIAGLYDTLETIKGDSSIGDGTMAKANALADSFEAGKAERAAARRDAVLSRRRAQGQCLELQANGSQYCRRKVPAGAELCVPHQAAARAAEGVDQAAAEVAAAQLAHRAAVEVVAVAAEAEATEAAQAALEAHHQAVDQLAAQARAQAHADQAEAEAVAAELALLAAMPAPPRRTIWPTAPTMTGKGIER